MVKELKTYLETPTINKSGFALDAGTTTQELNRIISGRQKMTTRMKEKLVIKLKADIENAQNLLNLLKG